MSVHPAVTRRLMRELSELRKNPPEGIRVTTSEENMLDVTGIIEGPEGTPYAGGYFRVKFKFTEEFPAAPPKCWFATKIFHPNVSTAGEICVNTLKKDWKSSYGIGHILITVKCLLIYPNPESALDEEAGKLLLDNYDSYCERAKLITSVHATPRVRPPEFDTPSSSSSSSAGTSASASLSLPKPTPLLPSKSPVPPAATTPILALPVTMSLASRKSTSPAPTTRPLRSSPSNTLSSATLTSPPADKDGKEGHTLPSPLSTADANVGAGTGQAGAGLPPAIPASPKKAVKRAATGGGVTGAEKRKKALKRL